MDDFDDTGLRLSDDEESGQLDRNIVAKTHFGGFEDSHREDHTDAEGRPKSRAEIMKEVIAKSKMHKVYASRHTKFWRCAH